MQEAVKKECVRHGLYNNNVMCLGAYTIATCFCLKGIKEYDTRLDVANISTIKNRK